MADVDVSLISDIAGRMLEELDDLVDAMNESVSEIVPSLAADRAITEEMSASNRANIENVLRNLRDDPSGPLPDTPPTEAREILRTVVRRGLELDVMFQSYRRGQTAVWQRFMQIAPMVVPPGPELVAVIERFAEAMFTYVDRVLLDLVAEAQRLREEMLGGALARRTETVRLILDGAPIDERVATGRLGYEVARDHTAVVLWLDDPVGDDGTLESVAASLARALGARPPLNISAGVRTMWAWLPREGDATVDRLRDAANAAPTGVRVAVGPTRWGLAGFRSSHADALVVEQLVAENAGGDRLVTFGDIAPIAALARDERAASQLVSDTLGALAADGERADRLRTTLRVYLSEADNASTTAERLHTHRNTILQRVGKATELLGHPPGERRLAVMTALDIVHFLGPRVLPGGPPTTTATQWG
ncbi:MULTISPECIES: PucR family transcriptional regulator [Gordonia]|uniref:Helix-turn-helix domain-containing protein n=2 Tax=Gordonia TaxID=2053 RepID=A0A9X3D7Z9_9ACTN|nr:MULTISPECIES: helix-turn-helix domain-containing protein [Gordonia]MAU81980.1 PucR family transcriptional regulator [Gordonia sp. (in: high G+C Gram-positive bacteria)]MCF3941237.1 helix-turn-helix domain-containing protein [Gordonia tangerina]MCX2966456.1 helix-turn-helix domain-containing protein [Gordonia aquimaris]